MVVGKFFSGTYGYYKCVSYHSALGFEVGHTVGDGKSFVSERAIGETFTELSGWRLDRAKEQFETREL